MLWKSESACYAFPDFILFELRVVGRLLDGQGVVGCVHASLMAEQPQYHLIVCVCADCDLQSRVVCVCVCVRSCVWL